jgi:hypothetical protein
MRGESFGDNRKDRRMIDELYEDLAEAWENLNRYAEEGDAEMADYWAGLVGDIQGQISNAELERGHA